MTVPTDETPGPDQPVRGQRRTARVAGSIASRRADPVAPTLPDPHADSDHGSSPALSRRELRAASQRAFAEAAAVLESDPTPEERASALSMAAEALTLLRAAGLEPTSQQYQTLEARYDKLETLDDPTTD